MSKPRPIFEGASWRVAMRCVNRQFLLTPTDEVSGALGYCLAVTSARHGILIHAFCAMSNHLHLDLTDPFAELSDFRRDFKSMTARSLNCYYGRWEYFWSRDDSMQEVSTPEAAIHGMAYTMTNPVAAGLVASPEAWPGLTTLPRHLGTGDQACTTFTFSKPRFFFRHEEDSDLPEQATLTLAPHPLGQDAEVFVKQVTGRVADVCRAKRAEVAEAGGTFAGVSAVLRRSHDDRPRTTEARGQVNPRFAEPDPERRVCRLVRYKAWLCEYAEALAEWNEKGSAVFPAGTNKMKRYPGVNLRPG